jgi:hypothetical protein
MKQSVSLSSIDTPEPAVKPQNIAKDKVPHYPGTNIGMQYFHDHPNDPQLSDIGMNKTSVFWDFENCPPPR